MFSILFVSLQHLTTVNRLNSWRSLIYIYKQPIEYLWFLYALFFVFVFIGLINIMRIPFHTQLVLCIILFVLVQLIDLPYFIYSAFSWLPCFYVGIIIGKNINILNSYVVFAVSLIITVLGLAVRIYLGGMWFRNNDMLLNTAIFKIGSIFLMFFLFYHFRNNKFFNYFEKYGKYSIIIYLVHLPFSSFFKIVLLRIGISNYFLFLFLLIFLSCSASIFICYLSGKMNVVNFFFHPDKYLKISE
ncbi:acetyl transferase [Companilactobacillus alimentarius DSM 20249]|nr:acetyl transferase [Companilactobacillus alimentarius DSM 20249]